MLVAHGQQNYKSASVKEIKTQTEIKFINVLEKPAQCYVNFFNNIKWLCK